jgi:hypothetical protein
VIRYEPRNIISQINQFSAARKLLLYDKLPGCSLPIYDWQEEKDSLMISAIYPECTHPITNKELYIPTFEIIVDIENRDSNEIAKHFVDIENQWLVYLLQHLNKKIIPYPTITERLLICILQIFEQNDLNIENISSHPLAPMNLNIFAHSNTIKSYVSPLVKIGVLSVNNIYTTYSVEVPYKNSYVYFNIIEEDKYLQEDDIYICCSNSYTGVIIDQNDYFIIDNIFCGRIGMALHNSSAVVNVKIKNNIGIPLRRIL